MTLKKLLNDISRIAIEEKIINCAIAGTSLYAMNPKEIDSYPVLFSSPTGNHLVEEYTTTYSISMFYFDRLTESGANDIDIYSASIEELKNLVKKIEMIDGVLKVNDGYNITNFSDTESFDDSICGAYCEIEVVCDNTTLCPED